MSRELPILCAGPVVRAILDGRQTQDRRPIKVLAPLADGRPSYPQYHIRNVVTADRTYPKAMRGRAVLDANNGEGAGFYEPAPWSPGDVLYVRETWRPYIRGWSSHVQFRAGNQHIDRPVCGPSLDSDASGAAMEWCATRGGVNEIECKNPDEAPWFPSIHMPKWAARIRLRVLSVGVERVNAISEEDAEAEGIDPRCVGSCRTTGEGCAVCALSLPQHFGRLWDSLYGAGSFDSGAWCWVTRFERVTT